VYYIERTENYQANVVRDDFDDRPT
jgi:hypothetical protein